MQLHQVQPKKRSKKQPRIGRGGRRGTYSGRGQKGQKSRAGHKIRPAIYDLINRLPKLRGYRNNPKSEKATVIKIGDLEKLGVAIINNNFFRKRGISKPKIVSGGELTKPLKIKAVAISKSAEEKVKAVGGSVDK